MSRFMGIKAWATPALLCLFSVLLSSCNSALMNPFRGVDPLEFTRANSAMTLVNSYPCQYSHPLGSAGPGIRRLTER